MAYKGKPCFFRVHLLDPADPFDGFLLEDITAKTVYRISRIYDDPAFFKCIYNGPDVSLLWIIRVYVNDHKHWFCDSYANLLKTNNVNVILTLLKLYQR